MITPHFSASEFACRDGTPYPPGWIETRLRPLCETLEVVRAAVGGPIEILSGYRTEAYNRKIGGARLSQHVQGRAADIRMGRASRIHEVVLDLWREGKLPNLGGLGAYPSFTHLDVRPVGKLVRWSGSRLSNVA
jgi:uncharacterized protein YcbK (DUF882 family)